MDATTTDERSLNHAIDNLERFNEHIAKLKKTQLPFVTLLRDWMENPQTKVVVVSGGPGTGKTFTVIETLKHTSLNVLKMAFTARIANKIGGKTLHSAMMLNWGEGSLLRKLEEDLSREDDMNKCLEASEPLLGEMSCRNIPFVPNVAVIDEAAMINSWLLYRIMEFLILSFGPLLIILMGDSRQLRPVKSVYNLFGVFEWFTSRFDTHRIDMTESMRFVQEYNSVVERLRTFVDHQDVDGVLEYLQEVFPVVETVDITVLSQCSRAMAHKNETVDAYNKFYIKCMQGERVRLYRLVDGKRVDKSRYLDVKPYCDLFVTENGCCKVSNGTPLVFLRYDANKDVIVCKDEHQQTVPVTRNKKGLFPVTHAFAGTVHKFQGDTLDDKSILFNFDGCRDLNLIYTALSRVRSMDQIRAIVL